jgi:hypothetical protein
MIVSPSRRLALFFALALPFLALAQTATVRGFVYDAASGEPSIFTPVSLRGATDHGAQTDVNGYFSISKVPPGHYTLRVVYLGYDTLHMELDLKADQIATEKLNLTRSSVEMKTVVISAEKKEAESTVRVGVTKLTPKQIERLPAIGGQADLAQYMQVVPGWSSPVTRAGSSTSAAAAPCRTWCSWTAWCSTTPSTASASSACSTTTSSATRTSYTARLQRRIRRSHQQRDGHHHPRRQQEPASAAR